MGTRYPCPRARVHRRRLLGKHRLPRSSRLDASFAGRRYDEQLLADLPPNVDPCGENGEFHTFVHAGPIFAGPIACATGAVVEREGFVFCDLA